MQAGLWQIKRLTGCAGIGIVLAALLPPAFAARPDPYPNQPGALSAAEIQAATRAMTPLTAGEAGFSLVSSGHPSGKFALFATSFARQSDRVETRQEIICFNVGGPWNCRRGITARVTKDGVAQEFGWFFAKVDAQAAVALVDFLYSPCFETRYAAIGGKPFTPSPQTDYINSVVEDDNGFGVTTGPAGGWVRYQLQRTDKPADNCGFDIYHVKTAKSGVILPASYASEVRAKDRQEQEMWREARDRRLAERPRDVVDVAMPGSILAALLALSVPWLCLLISRWAAAGTAGVLTIGATALFVIAEYYYQPGGDIRIDLLIIPPLLLAWLVFIGLTVYLKKQ